MVSFLQMVQVGLAGCAPRRKVNPVISATFIFSTFNDHFVSRVNTRRSPGSGAGNAVFPYAACCIQPRLIRQGESLVVSGSTPYQKIEKAFHIISQMDLYLVHFILSPPDWLSGLFQKTRSICGKVMVLYPKAFTIP